MKEYFWNKIPLEYFFVVIALFFGMRMVFVNPPWQTNDEDRHFYNSWYYANGYFEPESRDKKIGNPLPQKIIRQVDRFQGISFKDNKIDKEMLDSLKNI